MRLQLREHLVFHMETHGMSFNMNFEADAGALRRCALNIGVSRPPVRSPNRVPIQFKCLEPTTFDVSSLKKGGVQEAKYRL